MPKQIQKTSFKCVYCGNEYPTEAEATKHETRDHDRVLVPIERKDLTLLVNFIALYNESAGYMLPERLLKTLTEFVRERI